MLEERAAAYRADALELVEHRLARRRVAPRAMERDREPVGLVADPLQQLQAGECPGRRIGCDRPGTNTSSMRFASAITATRGRSRLAIASSAADS